MVPVHPEDRPLLGMSWNGAVYFDAVLPFGLCSALKIFTAIADALQWMVHQAGVPTVLHYLDNFLIVSTPDITQAHQELHQFLSVFNYLRVPVATDKLEGPATNLTFLGIELDTVSMTKRLPPSKLSELKAILGRKEVLSHKRAAISYRQITTCMQSGPARKNLLRRMFEMLKGVQKKQRFIRLNTAFRSDLVWWLMFLESWLCLITRLQIMFTTGCGAWRQTEWFQFPWPQNFIQQPIATKELLPVVLACLVWGRLWRSQHVLVHCDNQAVVSVVNSGYSKDSSLMQLLRCLFFIKASFKISLNAIHIKGEDNVKVDALCISYTPERVWYSCYYTRPRPRRS